MLNSLKALSLVVASLIATSGLAHAGDCKDVTLRFINSTGDTIRIENVVIDGNDGTWTEKIWNHRMEPGDPSHSTNPRRMNKLDSGQAPDSMTVEFDRLINNVWVQDSQRFTSQPECEDDDTYSMTLT